MQPVAAPVQLPLRRGIPLPSSISARCTNSCLFNTCCAFSSKLSNSTHQQRLHAVAASIWQRRGCRQQHHGSGLPLGRQPPYSTSSNSSSSAHTEQSWHSSSIDSVAQQHFIEVEDTLKLAAYIRRWAAHPLLGLWVWVCAIGNAAAQERRQLILKTSCQQQQRQLQHQPCVEHSASCNPTLSLHLLSRQPASAWPPLPEELGVEFGSCFKCISAASFCGQVHTNVHLSHLQPYHTASLCAAYASLPAADSTSSSLSRHVFRAYVLAAGFAPEATWLRSWTH